MILSDAVFKLLWGQSGSGVQAIQLGLGVRYRPKRARTQNATGNDHNASLNLLFLKVGWLP